MIYLDRVYQDGMVLQRQKPVLIRGISDRTQEITLRVAGKEVAKAQVEEGRFSLTLPPQEAAENVTVGIGDAVLRDVDFGEVWIAGGQSNMEFMLKYETGGTEEIASANDAHLRTYIVGQYSIPDERQDGFCDWKNWDRWLPSTTQNAPEFPAAAIFFAQEIRKKGIPVGILACNWGGTTASTWMDKKILEADEELSVYVREFAEQIAGIDLERYEKVNRLSRMGMNSPMAAAANDFIMKQTLHPDVLMAQMARMMDPGQMKGKKPEGMPEDMPKDVTPGDMMMVGPNDKNAPGRLYETMLPEIRGCTVRGVLWYQGESDCGHAKLYDKLFTRMIENWRKDWGEELPFLFVQIAPFGTWMGNDSDTYPALRQSQENVSKSVPGVYMTSISDLGNVYDIHPKDKKAVGLRLALLAEKYIYGEPVEADPPEAMLLEKEGDCVAVAFSHGEGLHRIERGFDSYNGFSLEEIREDLCPPVLDQICGLAMTVDGKPLTDARCSVENDRLMIVSPALSDAAEITVELGRTGFYRIDLYNRAGLPVKPFGLVWRKDGAEV